jgi:hypothetical protein
MFGIPAQEAWYCNNCNTIFLTPFKALDKIIVDFKFSTDGIFLVGDPIVSKQEKIRTGRMLRLQRSEI